MGSLFSSSKEKDNSRTSDRSKTNKSINNNTKSPTGGSINSKDLAVLDLKNARDKLKKFRKKLENDAEHLTEQAKKLLAEQKRDRALLVIKLRRNKEKEVTKLDQQLYSILEMLANVEWEAINMQVITALKEGNATLNRMHAQISVEDVEALMEETSEAIAVENQISELLSGGAGMLDAKDEEALLLELDQLMSGESNLSIPNIENLPEAPSNPVVLLPVVPDNPIQLGEKDSTVVAPEPVSA